MNNYQRQHFQAEDGKPGLPKSFSDKTTDDEEEVFPGVPIVRSNTPRPLSFMTMMSSSGQLAAIQAGEPEQPVFPAKAPSAPPLPEELVEDETPNEATSVPPSPSGQTKPEEERDFIWLFEYGLEMDVAILNSPERLDGQALLYGPAVLKGYTLMLGAQRIRGSNGPTIVAIVPDANAENEVWGVLYRVPQRLAEPGETDPSLLDTIHAAIAPQNFFRSAQVTVYEPYRERNLTCLTYAATELAYQQLHLMPPEQWQGDTLFVQRLATIARKQKLPEKYVRTYEPGPRNAPASTPARAEPRPDPLLTGGIIVAEPQQLEHTTEPLAAVSKRRPLGLQRTTRSTMAPPARSPRSIRLIVFATYQVFLLLVVIIFLLFPGLNLVHDMPITAITPLGVPWLVMVYGLLGGCFSCIVTLGRAQPDQVPLFIMITWFARPFIGALLAMLAFLLLTSGIFVLGDVGVESHIPLYSLTGALAGFCEGWIFVRRSTYLL